MNCELCELAQGNIITKQYFRDDLIIIVDCETCSKGGKHVPMGVIKRHDVFLTNKEYKRMRSKLMEIGRKVLGEKFHICQKPRKIRDHMHWHARPG